MAARPLSSSCGNYGALGRTLAVVPDEGGRDIRHHCLGTMSGEPAGFHFCLREWRRQEIAELDERALCRKRCGHGAGDRGAHRFRHASERKTRQDLWHLVMTL